MAIPNGSRPDISFLAKKYEEEKRKRLRADGDAQYEELESSTFSQLKSLEEDPWVDHDHLNSQPQILKDGQEVKFLALGAGFGGLVFSSYLVDAGFKPTDIYLVDTAGGFGGTWYWNRYPGLACDVEASIYLPWLERTGYRPRHRYAYGDEIRRYTERVAEEFGLKGQGVFRTRIESLTWDEARSRWVAVMEQYRGPKEAPLRLSVKAQYIILANGVLNHPKMPRVEGIEGFEGKIIHTGRWNYGVTGGSPTDARLTGLKDKRVGIVGTGATGVQCTAELAKWADQLYVFQRTPSGVDARGQRETDAAEWAKMTSKPGWWAERCENFDTMVSDEPVEEDLIKDGWSATKTLSVLAGAQHDLLAPGDIAAHTQNMLELDAPRTDQMRRRVDELVTKDKEAAEGLKAWYPTWCKRCVFLFPSPLGFCISSSD